MKVFLKNLPSILVLYISIASADQQPLSCPQTITCHYAPNHERVSGPFYYSATECKIDDDNAEMWKNFKINDNYVPSTVLTSKDWVTLSFAGAFIQKPGQFSDLGRPRCLYGVYDPYVPFYVSTMRAVNKKFLPAKDSSWQGVTDQYDKPLLVCDDKIASHCGMVLES
jgi:hypothetical protein